MTSHMLTPASRRGIARLGYTWLLLSSLVLAALSGVLSACSGSRASLKVVVSVPMQGVANGRSVLDAVRLALEERQGKVAGYSITLVELNNVDDKGQWDADLEKANAEQAVADPNVIAYIGPLHSGAAKVSIPITSRGGLVQISPGATWPGLTKVGYYPGEPARFYPTGQRSFYRTCPTDDVQAQAGVKWAKGLGFGEVYIIDDGEAYGKGLADLFEQRAQSTGLKVVGHESIDPAATNFIVTMSNLWHWKPDVVYFSGYPTTGVIPLLKQMRTVKPAITSAFMGSSSLVDSSFLEGAQTQAEGAYATLNGLPVSEWRTDAAQRFIQAYQAKYGRPPETIAIYGYDAAQVIFQALETATAQNRAGVLEAMAQSQTFTGAAGEFSFDQNGDTSLLIFSGVQVKDNQFTLVQVLDVK